MMRDKRRYILVESTLAVKESARKEFEGELFKELLHNIGEGSYFSANPRVMDYIGDNRFILKCSLEKYKEVIIALTFIKRLGGNPVGFYTLKASGTISALLKD